MKSEYLSYDQALAELSLGRTEMNDLVAKGELRAFRQGDEVRFKKDDVIALKKSRETEPTIVLADTRAESLSSGTEAPIDLESISTDETVLNIEGLLEDESEGTTPIPGATEVSGVGEDTVLDTEGLELEGEVDLSQDDTLLADAEEETVIARGSRQMQMVRKKSHGIMTGTLVLTMLFLVLSAAVLLNLVYGSSGAYPAWVQEYLAVLNPAVESVMGLFNS